MKREWRSLTRKVVYVLLMIPLIIAMSVLGRPGVYDSAGELERGGVLATVRDEHRLTQANLGEIDPASETLRLASLGMVGVASNLLWNQAHEYKKKEDWHNLRSVLDQIAKVQPNFPGVWRFQAWNLSYNVSAEFDDYKDRYFWVKEGIRYMERGLQYNRDHPRLLWDLGWFISHKVGRSDERLQFRRMFRRDTDFHGEEASINPDRFDNWLVGKRYFVQAQNIVLDTALGARLLGGMSPLVFHADVPMAQINYSDNLNVDGVFGERALRSWREAASEWFEADENSETYVYGDLEIPTSWGFDISLNDLEPLVEENESLAARLDALAPGVRETLAAKRRAELTPEQLDALDTPESLIGDRYPIKREAEEATKVETLEIADLAEPEDRKEARQVAAQIELNVERIKAINRYRQIVNFEYWRMRCDLERLEIADRAHELIYNGNQAYLDSDVLTAEESYREGMQLWRELIDRFPALLDARDESEDLMQVITNYRRILDAQDKVFPEDFILQDVVDRWGGSEYEY